MVDQEKGESEGLAEIPASTAARLLSLLLITRDDDLEGYRRRSIAEDSTVELDRLKVTREVAEILGATLLSTDEAPWQRLLAAHELLRSSVAASPVDQSRSAPPSPPPPAPEPFRVPTAASSAPPPPTPEPSFAPPALPPSPPPPAPTPPRSPLPPPPRPSPSAPPPVPPQAPAGPSAEQRTTARLSSEKPAGKTLSPFDRTLGTSDERLPIVRGDALPFEQRPAQPPPRAAVKDKPKANLGQTAAVGAISPLARLGALPFQQREGADADGSAPPAPAEAVRPGSSSPPSPGVASAAPDGASGSRPLAARAAEDDNDDGPDTADLGAKSPIVRPALPFVSGAERATGPRRIPELTVEQYASLTVASELHPDNAAETNQRFGVSDDAARRELDEGWSKRLGADAALNQKFQQLLTQYRDWHKRQG